MSGKQLKRGKGLRGPISRTTAIALLASPSMALAAIPPAPQPEPLNVGNTIHWFAAWDENHAPGSQDFIPTPSVRNNVASASFAVNQLQLAANAGKPLGIKVELPLIQPAADLLFDSPYGHQNKAISYVFADFEMGTPAQQVAATAQLVNQVRNSVWAKNAYVGQFNLTPLTGFGYGPGQDPTGRSVGDDTPDHSTSNYSRADYDSTRVNMANTALYPGSPTFRNRSTYDWANQNIRTGLFVGPIGRMTSVQNVLNTSYNGLNKGVGVNNHKQVPWVTRFNNWGNSSLDTDLTSANGYQFIPGAPLPQAGLSSNQTANQMMGRGDFAAQILHHRMRGAYSVNLFHEGGASGGVVGYSEAEAQEDVRRGWYDHSWNDRTVNIFAQPDSRAATMTLNPIVDGVADNTGRRSEVTGTIWSGQYSLTIPNETSNNVVRPGQGALDILVSNLDTVAHAVNFGTVDVYDVFIHRRPDNGWTYEVPGGAPMTRNILIEAGMHKLLQFDLVTTRVYSNSTFSGPFENRTVWMLNQAYNVFDNNEGRNDVGIPEPTTFGMLAAAGTLAVVCRRQRRKDEVLA